MVYRQIKADIGRIIRQLCEMKKVEIIEAEACPDHIHMLVSIPPNISVSQFVGYLKGKSSLMIFDRHANLKYKYGNRHFWCRGYYVDTVGRNKEKIAEYIRHQLDEDIMADQLSFKEYIDPFTRIPRHKKSPKFGKQMKAVAAAVAGMPQALHFRSTKRDHSCRPASA